MTIPALGGAGANAETVDKLATLIEIGISLSAERDRDRLLRLILDHGQRLCNCDAATMYLSNADGDLEFSLRTKGDDLPARTLHLYDPETGKPNENHVATWVALHPHTVNIEDVYAETRFDLSGTREFDRLSGYRTVSLLTVPMRARSGTVVGVLQFLNALDDAGKAIPFRDTITHLAEALAAQAAVAIDNHALVEARSELVDSIIRMIASAIDARSAHTGEHCARVPSLALMLAEAASASDEGALAAFRFTSAEQWREFRIGAWMHDCGKITTPDQVLDKGAKLEMFYNRIHEVRMRFEVLRRDAEIARLKALREGAEEEQQNRIFAQRCAQLDDDFRFVARANLGSELTDEADRGRLQSIALQTWTSHFDRRLGLTPAELVRMDGASLGPRDVRREEPLLADRPEHLVAHTARDRELFAQGFRVDVPEHRYNFGELHNLAVRSGTLTPEERFLSRAHVMHTLAMLELIPFPNGMQRIPEYAGTHHETLTGTGYPRRLRADQLSIPARIMAIADIFEAVTASDRPYRQPNTLSEAVELLSHFRDRGTIDAELFALFLKSGLHLRYAERFLSAEQIDPVDISRYL